MFPALTDFDVHGEVRGGGLLPPDEATSDVGCREVLLERRSHAIVLSQEFRKGAVWVVQSSEPGDRLAEIAEDFAVSRVESEQPAPRRLPRSGREVGRDQRRRDR